ncbi:THAP domain-containing protein 1-like [Rhipicephalus sanguineus]|uniref:THAP domain-containing protein 1-like n=1 Tax=Rhipicephalus sanguineus TaxID=34632 RepID=UPI0020C34258|nr:THAP domain-containing protein 1-like [Rhipicephalus sanguineus]
MPGCCVPQCSNSAKNGCRMFSFPRDPKRRLLWTAKIKRDKWQPTNHTCICNAHFEECCFEQKRADGWKKLKPNAVPTLFPFKVAPRKRKPPRERALPVPRLNHKEVSDPADVPHAASDVVEMLPESPEAVSQETSTDNMEVNSPGVEALNVRIANSTDETPTVSETQRDHAQLKKQLADIERKYATLQEHHSITTNTIQNLRKQVHKLESKAENFERNIRFLNADQVCALSKNSTQGHTWSVETVKGELRRVPPDDVTLPPSSPTLRVPEGVRRPTFARI